MAERLDPPLEVSSHGILHLHGHGTRVGVERGHLLLEDNPGGERRRLKLHPATSRLKRLILPETGSLSLAAVRWLHDAGAAIIVIGRSGNLLLASGPPQLDHIRLRRAQTLASLTEHGLPIVRDLLHRQLEGRLQNLERMPHTEDAREGLSQALTDLIACVDMEHMRQLEAAAADTYWECWRQLPLKWPKPALPYLPEHWLTFGPRTSPVGDAHSNRQAITPSGAMTNYLLAIVQGEAVIACQALDLDPGLSVGLHADVRYQAALAKDLLEAVRPAVESYLLQLLDRELRPGDHLQDRSGECRLAPELRRILSNTAPRWRALLAPIAEDVAQRLLNIGAQLEGRSSELLPKPLTERRRRKRAARLPALPLLPAACRECGLRLDDPSRRYCDGCVSQHLPRATRLAAARMARLRAEGRDPSHTDEARLKRMHSSAEQVRKARLWKKSHPGPAPDSEEFKTVIFPALRDVSIVALVRSTGLSRTQCNVIRRGMQTPHPRHWPALRELVSQLPS